MKPIALDLYCGLGGWAEGLLATGWDVIGFDIESRFIGRYPGQLVLQDALTFDGRRARGLVDLVVASPPCTEPSYRAMPWKRAKALNAAGPPHTFIALFNACFRIAEEIGCPVIVENVVGAQRWVGRAKYRYGSFYLWGDIPALMPKPRRGQKNSGGSWFGERDGKKLERNDPRDVRRNESGEWENAEQQGGWNHPGKALDGIKFGGGWWHDSTNNLIRKASSRSLARKEASARIAKIPFDLARWIGEVFYPMQGQVSA